MTGPVASKEYFRELVTRLAKERKMTGQKPSDLLQMLLDAKRDPSNEKSNFLDEEEAMANAVMFIGAGYDTSLTTLAFACYYLALDMEIQDKVVQELKTKAFGKDIDYETLNSLNYLEAVVMETLRKDPTDLRGIRRPVKDVTLEGIDLPKGQYIHYLTWVLQHDPDNFPDPEVFDPERFTDRKQIKPCSFMAFGAGPRMCPGNKLALMTIKVALAEVLRRFTFVRCPKTDVPPKYDSNSLMNRTNLIVKIQRRV
jgi:cytochrome P450 family 3 subfamily A